MHRARPTALVTLALTVAAVQFSVAIAQIFLAVALGSWVTSLVVERRRPAAPAWAFPLALFAGWTLVSVAFSISPFDSLLRSKQLVLFLLVPLVYDLIDEQTAVPLTTTILAAGTVSAVIGIVQFSIVNPTVYDDYFTRRPIGMVGFAMTYSGLIMLTLGLAVAHILFMPNRRLWPSLMLPALFVALGLGFLRNAWVGAGAGIAVLLMLRDFRLTAILPLVAALSFAVAPPGFVQRFYSIFDFNNATVRDRFAMMRSGERIIRDYPVTGVGPDMIVRVYTKYREPDAMLPNTPHLHNVPLQIAAERGLPALALWIWFVGTVIMGTWTIFRNAPRAGPARFAAAAALGAMASMLAAGLFEHNFGDSEFLMLFLVLITLPFAAIKPARSAVTAGSPT